MRDGSANVGLTMENTGRRLVAELWHGLESLERECRFAGHAYPTGMCAFSRSISQVKASSHVATDYGEQTAISHELLRASFRVVG